MRHHSLFVPRDFDISPYFEVLKPNLSTEFDPHELSWSEGDTVRTDALADALAHSEGATRQATQQKAAPS